MWNFKRVAELLLVYDFRLSEDALWDAWVVALWLILMNV